MSYRRDRRVASLVLLLLVGVTGCASGASGGGGGGGGGSVLTEAEMAQWATRDLFDVVQRLRPRWLQSRAPVTVQGRQTLTIILDGIRQDGGPELLRELRTSDIEEVRYLNARDATTRFGTDMTGGALIVVTKH